LVGWLLVPVWCYNLKICVRNLTIGKHDNITFSLYLSISIENAHVKVSPIKEKNEYYVFGLFSAALHQIDMGI